MKRLIYCLAMISIGTITMVSCSEAVKQKSNEKSTKGDNPAENMNVDTYNPGLDYKLTWSDEFNGETIDENNWNMQVVNAGRFNDEWQRYTNSEKNAYIDNNCLVIKAIHESDVHGMNQYTSARLNTANKQAWKYGKIVARIKLPFGAGIWPAFWMLGANISENGGDTPWPQAGEVDIMEFYGSKDEAVVEANIHYANEKNAHSSMGAKSYKLKKGKFSDAFHIFELEWNENKFAWSVDGKEFASTPISSPELSEFHKEFFILLNVAVGGEYAGRPNQTSTFPQHMYVDWVRVYQK
jgi:beta-glucanase (GH16 family)